MKNFKSALFIILFSMGFISNTLAAPTLELSPENWKTKLADKTVLIYMSLGCDIGSYASQMFQEAMTDLEGVYVSTFDVNSAYDMMQGKPYDLGTIALIHNGKVLESSKETYTEFHYLSGYNNQQAWVYNALSRHNISFSMPNPGASRLEPISNTGSVDLSKGLNAIYRFNNLKDETGQKGDFRLIGTSTLKDGAFYADGIYDKNYSGGEYSAAGYGEKAFKNGFTVHANIKVQATDKQRKFVLSFGYRAIDFEINKDQLLLGTSLHGKVSEDEYKYANDFYPLTEVPFKYNEWNSIIFSTDVDSRRMALIINGKRYKDIQLSKRFVEFFHQYGMGYQGVRLHNHGWGGILNGYADDIVVYDRKLNDNELKALHQKYSKNLSTPSPDDEIVNPIKNTNDFSAWVGDWYTSWGKELIYTHMKVENSELVGTYEHKDGRLHGTVKQEGEYSIFEGSWEQENTKGWFKFKLKAGDQQFSGSWGYDGNTTIAGEWTGYRR